MHELLIFTAHSSKKGPERQRGEQSSSRGIIPEERDEEWERKVLLCHSPHRPSAALISTNRGTGNEAGDTRRPAATCRLSACHRNNLSS